MMSIFLLTDKVKTINFIFYAIPTPALSHSILQ